MLSASEMPNILVRLLLSWHRLEPGLGYPIANDSGGIVPGLRMVKRYRFPKSHYLSFPEGGKTSRLLRPSMSHATTARDII